MCRGVPIFLPAWGGAEGVRQGELPARGEPSLQPAHLPDRPPLFSPPLPYTSHAQFHSSFLDLTDKTQDELLPLLVNRLDSTESIIPYDYYQ